MKMQTKTLLAGVAALALMAGTGLASAQEQNSGKQPQTSSSSMKSSAAPKAQGQSGVSHMGQNTQPSGNKMGMEQASPSGKFKAQQQTKGMERYGQSTSPKGEASTTKGRQAQEINRGQKGNFERNGTAQTEQKGSTATRGTRSSGTTVSEQRNGLQGLQGNASHVTLNDEQRTKIRQTVISAHGAPRVSHVDFDLAVGTVVPRGHIHFVPVPRLLVDIEPAWRGYDYFIYEDELVIIDPRTMTIIAVVPV
jgi:hypothetical protein